jgi:hypothetical protein
MTASSHRSTRTQGRWALLALCLAVLLMLAACAGAAAPEARKGGQPAVGDELSAAADTLRGDAKAPLPGTDTSSAYADLVADRQIVKTGEITLQVASVSTAVGTIRAMALEVGGYVGGSSAGGPDEAATLTLRIPADRFDTAIDRIHALDGKLVAEATREEDVTGSVVDLDARIRNLQASEAQYRALLGQATKIDDILSVQSRLDDVRGQIEQLQAQYKQLSDLAQLATLTVTLVPASAPIQTTAEGWDAGTILESAVAALVGVGQVLATAAIWLAIVGLPVILVVGVLALVALRLLPPLRRRTVKAAE